MLCPGSRPHKPQAAGIFRGSSWLGPGLKLHVPEAPLYPLLENTLEPTVQLKVWGFGPERQFYATSFACDASIVGTCSAPNLSPVSLTSAHNLSLTFESHSWQTRPQQTSNAKLRQQRLGLRLEALCVQRQPLRAQGFRAISCN